MIISYFHKFNPEHTSDSDIDISSGVDLTIHKELVISFFENDPAETDVEIDDSCFKSTFNRDLNLHFPTTVELYKEYYDYYSQTFKRKQITLVHANQNEYINDIDNFNIIKLIPSDSKFYSFKIYNLNLDYDFTYILVFNNFKTINAGLLFDKTYNEISFKTLAKQTHETTTYTKLSNNINEKIKLLSKLTDADQILNNSDCFNFEYGLTQKNEITGNYEPVLDNLYNQVSIKYDNASALEELFLKQYLPEFYYYFKDISNPSSYNEFATIKSRNQIQTLKTIIAKNSTIVNNFKGTRKGIEFLHGIFAEGLGYQIISVDPDIYQNFVYSITTTLPIAFWERDIKPIVHPCGWLCRYIYIDLNPNVPFLSLRNFKKNIQVWYKRNDSYIDAAFSHILNYKNKQVYSDIVIGNLSSELKFNFNNSEYFQNTDRKYCFLSDDHKQNGKWILEKGKTIFKTNGNFTIRVGSSINILGDVYNIIEFNPDTFIFTIDKPFIKNYFLDESIIYSINDLPTSFITERDGYYLSDQQVLNGYNSYQLLRELLDKQNYKLTADFRLSRKQFSLAFSKSGIGLKYQWFIFKNGVKIGEQVSSYPHFNHELLEDSCGFTAQLMLHSGDWYQAIGEWDLTPYHPRRENTYTINAKHKFLDFIINARNLMPNSFITFGSYTSYYTDTSTVATDDFEIDYTNASMLEEISAAGFTVTKVSSDIIQISYNLSGLFTSYEWEINYDSVLINKLKTTSNHLILQIAGGLDHYSINLNLINDYINVKIPVVINANFLI